MSALGARLSAAPLTKDLEVTVLQKGEEDQWDQFVTESPDGTFFHLSGWGRVVEKVIGHRCMRLVARREGKVAGVFPMNWIRNHIFGDCLVSQSLAVYGGICADSADA